MEKDKIITISVMDEDCNIVERQFSVEDIDPTEFGQIADMIDYYKSDVSGKELF